jgi:hypothetical protein
MMKTIHVFSFHTQDVDNTQTKDRGAQESSLRRVALVAEFDGIVTEYCRQPVLKAAMGE